MALPTKETIVRIIQNVDNNEELVTAAEQVGKELARLNLTTSQIRGIFGTVRRIELDWPSIGSTSSTSHSSRVQHAQRELMLLKPRLAYQAERERRRGAGVIELSHILIPAIDAVGKDRQRFQNFVDFFEAILAYHRASGGKDS